MPTQCSPSASYPRYWAIREAMFQGPADAIGFAYYDVSLVIWSCLDGPASE